MKFSKLNGKYYNRHFIGELFDLGYVQESVRDSGFIDSRNLSLLEIT